MTDALAHRGPDGSGYHVEPNLNVHFGHRRLAIVDLDGGHQPMFSADGQICVIFNGEIYNHLELKDELEAKGYRFQSHHSDTEVLVYGYRCWGNDLPSKLNGMFAFAVFDLQHKSILIARDRFGEKPLYYFTKPGLFAFASELTSLAMHPGVPGNLDWRAIQKFFAWGYLPAPNSMIEGARKLPGGHALRYDIASDTSRISAYWSFALEPDHSLTDADEDALVEECSALLSQAARRRLMSDVPLGMFLSGGIDSSAILGSLSHQSSVPQIKTFTIGFTEPSFDESGYARLVAETLGSDHSQRDFDMDLAREVLPAVLGRMDEPLGDASILPTYLLAGFTREHATVALSGDGGDELFAGYDPFLALGPAALYRRLVPGWMHRSFARLIELLPISHANMSIDFKLRRAMIGLSQSAAVQLPAWMAPLDPRDMKDLFEEPLNVDEVYSEALQLWDRGTDKAPVDRALEFFTQFYLQDDILMKVDRASMMHSLESRAVFLDNDLVEFCSRLPHRFKLRNGERKYLLKKVARTMLPASIVDRKKKGFGIPLAKWLKEIPATPPLSPLPGVKLDYVRNAFADHRSGTSDERLFLWSWLCVQSFQNRNAELDALV